MNLKRATFVAFIFTLINLLFNLYLFVGRLERAGYGSDIYTMSGLFELISKAAICLFFYILYRKQLEAKRTNQNA